MVLWEKLKEETNKAYKAFCFYRDMGSGRSMPKACKILGKKPGYAIQLERWSRNFAWVKRAEAYDLYLEAEVRRVSEKERLKMHERHAKQAMLFQQKMLEKLQTLNPSDLSPADLAKFFEVSTKIERLSRGDSSEKIIQENTGKDGGPIKLNDTAKVIDLSRLSVKELKDLANIVRRARSMDGSGTDR